MRRRNALLPVLLALAFLALAASPSSAHGQPRSLEDIGASHFEWEGDEIVFYDVWEAQTVEETVCTEAEQRALDGRVDQARRRFWEAYDPSGYVRGQDLSVEACLARGDGEAACQTAVEEEVSRREDAFFERCFESGSCRRAYHAPGRLQDECKRRYVQWNYYRERRFEVPCQPFDRMTWEDNRIRDDWDVARGWVARVDDPGPDNRGFVGDPGFLDFIGLGGKPMYLRSTREAARELGYRPKIGSYFFADLKYGRLSFQALRPEEAGYEVKVTLPEDYKEAGELLYGKHAWTKHLYVCEATFTREEIKDLYRSWGFEVEGVSSDP